MSHHLLIVDDSDDHRFITVTELRRLKPSPPFILEEAARGEDALAAIERLLKHKADLLVLADYRMPRMTGIELARAIRTKYPRAAIRIVIYSSTDQGVNEESLQAGADEFMVKPMDLQQFRASLKRLVDDWYAKRNPAPGKPVRRPI